VGGRVRARDDVIQVAAEPERRQARDVVGSRRGRVVRGEEHLPARGAQARQGLAGVRHHDVAAMENAVHVEDRDRHQYAALYRASMSGWAVVRGLTRMLPESMASFAMFGMRPSSMPTVPRCAGMPLVS